jgi:DNA-binding NarL/FixJ family response regulator
MPDSVHSWPFAGRDTELQALVDALARHGTVVIVGEAGVGKSRLARELIARTAGSAGSGFALASESAREVPLAPFAPWAADESPESPESPGTPASPVAPDASVIRRLVESLRSRGPGWVLGVDDAHLLDAVSAAVVAQLAADHTVRLVVTVRYGLPTPDAITALWKDDLAARVDLARLSAEQTHAVLETVLGGPVESATEQRLHTISGGNVLWLRHLVEAERTAGRLTRGPSTWRLVAPPEPSPALEDLVATRIGHLSDAEQRAMELLAFGEPIGLLLLHRLAEPAAVEELSERGLVDLQVEGVRQELRLSHPLYGEVVRARTSPLRARRLRGELAAVLGTVGGRRAGDELRRAVLGLGGDIPLDAATLVRAASQATALGDIHLAERLFRAACEAGGGFDASIGLAQTLSWLMRPEEAEAELAAATEAAADDLERARAAASRVFLLYFVLERTDQARAVLEEATARAASVSPAASAELSGIAANIAALGNRFDEARDRAATVLSRADSPPLARIWAAYATGIARACSGTGPPVADVVEDGIAATRGTADAAVWQLNLGYTQVLDAAFRAEFDDARARIVWLGAQPGPVAVAFVALYEARVALETGRPATAVRLVESIVDQFPGSGGGWSRMLHTISAEALAMLGDVDAARAALRRADETAHPGIQVFDPENELAHALLAAADGRLVEAIGRAGVAAAAAHSAGQFAVEVVIRHTAVCFGDRSQRARLAQLTEIVDGRRARAALAHAVALAARDADGLLAVSRSLEDAELEMFAAEAAAQAAMVARGLARLGDAARAADRAAALAHRCEDARTPTLAASLSPLPISDREREVIHHAARGLSNRQIAEQLHVSVRTVESHIYRACTRLGLTDRGALVSAVVPTGLAPDHGDGAGDRRRPAGMQ